MMMREILGTPRAYVERHLNFGQFEMDKKYY